MDQDFETASNGIGEEGMTIDCVWWWQIFQLIGFFIKNQKYYSSIYTYYNISIEISVVKLNDDIYEFVVAVKGKVNVVDDGRCLLKS